MKILSYIFNHSSSTVSSIQTHELYAIFKIKLKKQSKTVIVLFFSSEQGFSVSVTSWIVGHKKLVQMENAFKSMKATQLR